MQFNIYPLSLLMINITRNRGYVKQGSNPSSALFYQYFVKITKIKNEKEVA